MEIKTETKTEVTATMKMTKDEAVWLRDFLQNSNAVEESKEDAAYRAAFFGALHQALTFPV